MSIRNTYLIRRHPAFQAGFRGFESRLPLSYLHRLFASRLQAAWRQPGSVWASKGTMFLCVKRRAATSCLVSRRHPASRRATSCLLRGVTSCPVARDLLPTRRRDILPLAPNDARLPPGAKEAVKEAITHEREQVEEIIST